MGRFGIGEKSHELSGIGKYAGPNIRAYWRYRSLPPVIWIHHLRSGVDEYASDWKWSKWQRRGVQKVIYSAGGGCCADQYCRHRNMFSETFGFGEVL